MNNQQQGFTVIEFVVVVSLMALLATVVIATTHHLRTKARDTRRVALVGQMQSALEAYYRDQKIYPPTAAVTVGQPLTAGGINYFHQVPSNPEPWTDGDCLDQDFIYSQDSAGVSYSFTFCLGQPSADLSAGINTATPAGIYSQ